MPGISVQKLSISWETQWSFFFVHVLSPALPASALINAVLLRAALSPSVISDGPPEGDIIGRLGVEEEDDDVGVVAGVNVMIGGGWGGVDVKVTNDVNVTSSGEDGGEGNGGEDGGEGDLSLGGAGG